MSDIRPMHRPITREMEWGPRAQFENLKFYESMK